jgi:hypothetical protein
MCISDAKGSTDLSKPKNKLEKKSVKENIRNFFINPTDRMAYSTLCILASHFKLNEKV